MQQPPARLWNYGFVTISVAALFASANLAVFYSFYAYLRTLGVPAAWMGTLVALEPMAALVLRPLLSPLLTPRNSPAILMAGMAALALALVLYPLARTVPLLAALRLFHGIGFVVLVSAAMVIMVDCIPEGRSAQAFGVFTIMTQIPYALMPLVLERLTPLAGGTAQAYALVAPAMLPAMLLTIPLLRRARGRGPGHGPDAGLAGRSIPRPAAIAANLRQPGVARLLGAALLLHLGTTAMYFFIKSRFTDLDLPRVDLFFTVATAAIIATRVAGAWGFSRLDRRLGSTGFLVLTAASLAGMGRAGSLAGMLGLAAVYGLSLGVALPMLSSAMFLRSAPEFRGLNSNLMMSMMDLGFFLGPLCWAGLHGGGMGWGGVYALAAIAVLGGAGVAWFGVPAGAESDGKTNR